MLRATAGNFRSRKGLLLAAVALLAGAATGVFVGDSLTEAIGRREHQLATPLGRGESVLGPSASDKPTVQLPLATRAAGGFEVALLGTTDRTGSRLYHYTIKMDGSNRFADMLGIPRIVSPDGSFVLPSEYGATGNSESRRPGLSADQGYAVVFAAETIPAGGILRFGPFFRGLDESFELERPASAFRAGVEVQVRGERFVVSLKDSASGLYEMSFQSIDRRSVVISHPMSRARVFVDGSEAADVKGYTKFAKTEALDVSANTSGVIVAATLRDDSIIRVFVDSIGEVVTGAWDFPLD